MPKAYVLINCDLGSEEEVIDNVKQLDEVREISGTFGAYDIIAKVESETDDSLRDTITRKIRKMNKIRSTLTLMIIESQG